MSADRSFSGKPLLVSANSCWNLLNFRAPLLRAFVNEGFRVVAAAPLDGSAVELSAIGVEVEALEMDSRSLSPVGDARLLLNYHRVLQQTEPAAFLAFTPKPNIYGSIAAGWQNVPIINTVTGLGTTFLSGKALQKFVSLLYRVSLARSHRVFFHNDDDRDLFLQLQLVSRKQASVVAGSGIDLTKFSVANGSNASAAPKGPVTFLFVGRLLRDKGLAEFIEAAAMVKALYPTRFQVLGALETHPKAISPELASERQRAGVIELLGGTNDVRSFIANADCVVLPSYREGLPRVLLEASSMGKPVIATNVPGCRQAVDNGVTGLLCEPRSANSLADAMVAFLRMSPQDRAALGSRGRAKAEREFSEERIVAAYLKALDDLRLNPFGTREVGRG